MNEEELRREFESFNQTVYLERYDDGSYVFSLVDCWWHQFKRAAEWADARARRECAAICNGFDACDPGYIADAILATIPTDGSEQRREPADTVEPVCCE